MNESETQSNYKRSYNVSAKNQTQNKHDERTKKQQIRNLEQSIKNIETQLQLETNLQNKAELEEKSEKLKEELLKMISPSEISIQRLTHLQEIFKHYCTHIFRVGKHMTFDRLQYEKIHMTIERFFTFLKDFELTTMKVDGKPKQIVSKNKIIMIFKRVSSTSKDLTFEQFIECLQKIAIIYYDEKQSYFDKQKLELQKRRKRLLKQADLKKKKKVIDNKNNNQNQQQSKQKQQDQNNQQQNNNAQQNHNKQDIQNQNQNNNQPQVINQNKQQNEEPNEEPQNPNQDTVKYNQQQKQNNQNQTPENQTPENQHFEPQKVQVEEENNNSINLHSKELESNQFFNDLNQVSKNKQKKQTTINIKQLSDEEKVEYFYKLIGVDNIRDYRNKLSELNLPVFKNHEKKSKEKAGNSLSDSNIIKNTISEVEDTRIQKIKQKINEKNAIAKNLPPKNLKKDENQEKRLEQERQRRKQREKQRLLRKSKDENPKKKQNVVQPKKSFNQNSVTWAELDQLNYQQLNQKQFHHHNFYQLEAEDQLYMGQFNFDQKVIDKYKGKLRGLKKSSAKIQKKKPEDHSSSNLLEKKGQTVIMNAKKRASEVQRTEKTKQKNMDDISRKLSDAKAPRSKLKI